MAGSVAHRNGASVRHNPLAAVPANPPGHLQWFTDTGNTMSTACGSKVAVWELKYVPASPVLSEWARHFREHYCADDEIDLLRKGTPHSRSEYLQLLKFPDAAKAPGPSIRSGDFAEILVADYLEYLLNHWVPRTRYSDKSIRNESTKGCDVIGFQIIEPGKDSKHDKLTILETKAQLTGQKVKNRLQDAVDDSMKDAARKADSLNAIKQRLILRQKLGDASKVERFQDPVDRPYSEQLGAVAVVSTSVFDPQVLAATDASKHPQHKQMALVVIHGTDLMSLANELYKRAADEA